MTGEDRYSLNEPESEEAALAGRSYLVVDYGHSACMATLYDLVEGRYRLIGRGEGLNTAGPPWFDISHGLLQAIGQISDATGRELMSLQGQLIRPSRSDGSGVDYFGATVSLGDPLRVVVAGLLENTSIASARKALQAVYAEEVDCFSLTGDRGRPGQIQALLDVRPDVIFLVGGTDGGADKQVLELTTTLAIALELQDESSRPVVVYGGNASLRSLVMDDLAELTEVHLVDNVQPSFAEEQIGHAIAMLAQIYYSAKIRGNASSGVLDDWCNTAPMISAHTFGGIAEYLAATVKGRVLGLDVGSSQVTLLSAVDGQVDLVVRTDKGLGQPAKSIMDGSYDEDELGRLVENGSGVALDDYILDKNAHPNTLPLNARTAEIELAIMGYMVRQVLADAAVAWSWPANGSTPEVNMLLLRGRIFANAPDRNDALAMALDALQLRGAYKVLVDGCGVLPAMGLLAGEDPDMVVQVLSGNDLEQWAWVIAPSGQARQGEKALTVSMQSRSLKTIEVEVPFG